MTYFVSDEIYTKRLQICEITISGSPSNNQYFTLSSSVIDNFDSGTAPTGGGTTSLTFPSGSYMFRAVLDVTRSSNSDNYKFQFEVASTLKGTYGQTALYDNLKSDVAEATHKASSDFIVKLKCIGVENSEPTLTNNSKIYIWRTS